MPHSTLRALWGKTDPSLSLKLLWELVLNCLVGSGKGLISFDSFFSVLLFPTEAYRGKEKNIAQLKVFSKICCHFLSSLKFLLFKMLLPPATSS